MKAWALLSTVAALSLCFSTISAATAGDELDLRSLFEWRIHEGEGIRLHVVPGSMNQGTVERLLEQRTKAAGRLRRLYEEDPPKSIDIFFVPAGQGISGVHVFPRTWKIVTTWDGTGSVEDRFPARSLTRLFLAAVARHPREPHPFVAEGLARVGDGPKEHHHELLVGRLLADGYAVEPVITDDDLAAERELARIAAGSFMAMLQERVGSQRLTVLARTTTWLGWTARSLTQRFFGAVQAVGGASLDELFDRWGARLRTIETPFTMARPYESAIRRSLKRKHGEELRRLLPYRDEPLLTFVAETESAQRYLVQIKDTVPVIVSRWRRLQPQACPEPPLLVAGASADDEQWGRDLLQPFLHASGDAQELEGILTEYGVSTISAADRAAMLAIHLERLRLVSVERTIRIVAEFDLGPSQGTVRAQIVSNPEGEEEGGSIISWELLPPSRSEAGFEEQVGR